MKQALLSWRLNQPGSFPFTRNILFLSVLSSSASKLVEFLFLFHVISRLGTGKMGVRLSRTLEPATRVGVELILLRHPLRLAIHWCRSPPTHCTGKGGGDGRRWYRQCDRNSRSLLVNAPKEQRLFFHSLSSQLLLLLCAQCHNSSFLFALSSRPLILPATTKSGLAILVAFVATVGRIC